MILAPGTSIRSAPRTAPSPDLPMRCSHCGATLSSGFLGGMCSRCIGRLLINGKSSELPVTASNEHEGLVGEGIGTRIGRYTLVGKLGEGGCGAVYSAHETNPLAPRVALKIVKLGMDTKAVVTRFRAESRNLAKLNHPNIARLFDAGATGTGRPYFVMELIDGVRITSFCDQHRLSIPQRVTLFVTVCLAVQHAHENGIIHRDLKASNILVTGSGANPTPKIIDFGVSKVTEACREDETLTAHGQVFGTPAYMSPEQTEFRAVDIDPRSDIYNLGALFYELLTGTTPLDPTELARIGFAEAGRAISEALAVPPGARVAEMRPEDRAARTCATASHHLVRELRGNLDQIVMKCLQKDRNRRYQTAGALAEDLYAHLAGKRVVGPVFDPGHSLRNYASNYATRHAAVVVAAGLLVAMGINTVRQTRRATAAEALAAERAVELKKARLDRGFFVTPPVDFWRARDEADLNSASP